MQVDSLWSTFDHASKKETVMQPSLVTPQPYPETARSATTAILLDDQAIIEKILNHIDRGSTDLSSEVWREPVDHYTSQVHFESEISQVLQRSATVFCPSAALPEVGSFMARDVALMPVLVVRGEDGVVRAFKNSCRHRGVQVLEGTGCKKAMTCRYHAWTYDLQGRLRAIPDEDGFPGLDKAQHGLVPLKAFERRGLVYITQEGLSAPDVELDPLPDFSLESWRYVQTTEQDFEANWKIVAEGFLEGYHIRSTHRDTFFPRQYDNINVIEAFGRNSRVTFPYRNIERLREVPVHQRRLGGTVTQVYHLFPNVMIATFPTHVTISVLEPLAIDRTRLVTHTLSTMLDKEEDRETVARRLAFVNAGSIEDREVACSAQKGLSTGANQVFTFGLFEGAIRHLHVNLKRTLALGHP
jgi:phenylpropionate dioxygenase-like ring-hydroxylating dioxygenase large terminal subunit